MNHYKLIKWNSCTFSCKFNTLLLS